MATQKKINTISNIIASTKRLYKLHAYEGTSMQMIADEAGISKSLLTHYFPQKHLLLTTITRAYLESIGKFIKKKYPDDPLLIMLLTYKIFFRNIIKDPVTKKFWSGSMNRMDRGMDSYNNSDYLYVPVFKQYDTMMGEREFMLRKMQIMGGNTELSYVYFNQIYEMSDDEFIDQQLKLSCTLLGVSNFSIINYMQKSDKLLETLDYSGFKLLE